MLFCAVRMMYLEHGFLHCDIHQGNWAYCANEKDHRVRHRLALDTDVSLCTELLYKVFHNNIDGAVRVFMERMLSKKLGKKHRTMDKK